MKAIFRAAAGLFFVLGLAAHADEIRVESEVQAATKSTEGLARTKQARARATHFKTVILPAPAADVVPKAALAHTPGTPLQIGSGRDVPGLTDDATAGLDWESQSDGSRVAALSITSPTAAALRAGIRVFAMPPEATLRFYGPTDETLFEVTGAKILETLQRNVAAGDDSAAGRTFWSPAIDAETLLMEIELPAGVEPAQLKIGVPQVTHLITSSKLFFVVPKVGAFCEQDAMCSQATWSAQINAVTRMLFNVGSSGFLCTGTLLADSDPSTTIPYLLSANHCISDQTSASTLQTYWFYHSTSCNSGVASAPTVLSGGATLLYASNITDTSFMRLNATPPAGAVYAGWIVSSSAFVGTSITGLHHPTGDYLRISNGIVTGNWACTPASGGSFSCNSGGTFYGVNWNGGITEPGSSGSGVFMDVGGSKYLVGQLYGGSSSCSNSGPDFYGRLDVAYNAALSQWLAPPATPTLTVARLGNGTGTITSSPSGISCGVTCSATFPANTSVTLTAAAAGGSTFAGWTGACSGSANTCTVTVSGATAVNATFYSYQTLSVIRTGTGTGTVTSSPSVIACGTICSGSFLTGTSATLTATPAAGQYFFGWSGACSGTGQCTLTMNAPVTVTANFSATAPVVPSITVTVSGSGQVNSADYSIFCSPTCNATYAAGSVVTLTAHGQNGTAFTGWGGACSGTSPTCTLTVSTALAVTATFGAAPPPPPPPAQQALTVALSGTGSGSVMSSPAGISCGATCSANFAQGSSVTLTPTAASGSTFSGWSGACSGTGACMVTMNAATSVGSSFTLNPVTPPPPPTGTPSITGSVTGMGLITTADFSLFCPTICTANYPAGTVVTLTARGQNGTAFSGWGGACSGTSPTCTLTVNGALAVSASFGGAPPPPPPAQQTLTVTSAGAGTGTVTSNPAGINCGATCSASFAQGTAVTLNAAPASGSTFSGWSGACSGTGSCVVTLNAASAVTATFASTPPAQQPLMVALSGTGSGSVTSSPAGISCGAMCSANFAQGSSVTLTPTAASGSTFSGWSGACSGTGACMVTMNAATSVGASFTLNPVTPPPPPTGTPSITVTTSGSGQVNSADFSIFCSPTCTANYAAGSVVTLTARGQNGTAFSGWGGACSGTSPTCTLTVNGALAVSASFGGAAPPPPTTMTLTVATSGTGAGSVVSAPAGISCGATCSASFTTGTSVALTATAASGSTFAGWSGACSGTGSCVVPLNTATSVSAAFTANTITPPPPPTGTPSITASITGMGLVHSADYSLFCSGTCTTNYPAGSVVTLTAQGQNGRTFLGWGGACSGTSPSCTLTVNGGLAVSAQFTP